MKGVILMSVRSKTYFQLLCVSSPVFEIYCSYEGYDVEKVQFDRTERGKLQPKYRGGLRAKVLTAFFSAISNERTSAF